MPLGIRFESQRVSYLLAQALRAAGYGIEYILPIGSCAGLDIAQSNWKVAAYWQVRIRNLEILQLTTRSRSALQPTCRGAGALAAVLLCCSLIRQGPAAECTRHTAQQVIDPMQMAVHQ
jgi:hypothetical protein